MPFSHVACVPQLSLPAMQVRRCGRSSHWTLTHALELSQPTKPEEKWVMSALSVVPSRSVASAVTPDWPVMVQ